MLTLRREAIGLTQAALADRLGISQAKLSRIEADLYPPDDGLVNNLALALGRPRNFFFLRERIYGPGVSEFFHHKRQAVGAKPLRQAHAMINEDIFLVSRLLRSVELDRTGFDKLKELDEADWTPEGAAKAVRAMWKLPKGPIKSVTGMIEDAGGIVFLCDFPSTKIFAISRWVPGLPPLFFIGKDTAGDHQRFALCHELAHLILHQAPNPHMEIEAQRFAAELLMPDAEIRSDFGSGVTLERLAVLKPYWKVSMRSLLYRAETLGLIAKDAAKFMWMKMGKLGYQRREPAELAIPQEKPSLLAELTS
jgi:Zn-dependent peptidase ImmA (M78 family)/transcriptional regulator with XRE-family HTH domain